MEHISLTPNIHQLAPKPTGSPRASTRNTGERRPLKPLMVVSESVNSIMMRLFNTMNYENLTDYQAIVKHLDAFGRANVGWDSYSKNVDVELLNLLKSMLTECARQGFIAPHVDGGSIKWRQIMTHGRSLTDYCTLCRRPCTINFFTRDDEGRYLPTRRCYE